MSMRIEIPQEKIAAFCCRYHIRRLAFFGSVLRNDFTPESDMDLSPYFRQEVLDEAQTVYGAA